MTSITQQSLMTAKQRLVDSHTQMLQSDINDNPLCIMYRTFKCDADYEFYLSLLKNKERLLITKLRCGSHKLPISIQRYLPIDEQNSCPYCSHEVGDEYHFILVCPKFQVNRAKYINRSHWDTVGQALWGGRQFCF